MEQPLAGHGAGHCEFSHQGSGVAIMFLGAGEELLLIEKDTEILDFLIWARRIFKCQYFSLSGLSRGNCRVLEKRAKVVSWSLGLLTKE